MAAAATSPLTEGLTTYENAITIEYVAFLLQIVEVVLPLTLQHPAFGFYCRKMANQTFFSTDSIANTTHLLNSRSQKGELKAAL